MSTFARKRFGQHFLTDPQAIADIVAAIDPQPGDHIIEIGPGRAALTRAILDRHRSMAAIEIDRDLVLWLRARYTPAQLVVHEADALSVDYSAHVSEGRKLRLIGNLPYNISSPLLVHLIAHRHAIQDQHFMLQKEVVERIVAAPGQSAYGRLTVLLQTFYQVQALFDVDASSFDPPPKVQSSVLRMRERPQLDETSVPSLAAIEQLTAQAFAQKRKMLRNTLLPWLHSQGLDATAISPNARAEEVPVQTYTAIALQLDQLDRRSMSSTL